MADPSKIPEPEPDLHSRHLVRAPGPGRYDMSKYSDFAPGKKGGAGRWSFGGKPRVRREDETPGPDKYAYQRSSLAGTKWTMAAKPRSINRDAIDELVADPNRKPPPPPAPVPSYIGKGGPKFSMSGRTHAPRSDQTPDPAAYNPLAALKTISHRTPAFSMGAKPRAIDRDPYYTPNTDDKKPAAPPAPVKTLIGTGGPKFSFGGRPRRLGDEASPGPGAYNGASSDLLGKEGPRFSMSARVRKGVAYGFWGDEPKLGGSQSARR